MTSLKALLICSGDFSREDLDEIEINSYYKVAVDGGLEHFLKNNIIPDIFIGDMDSVKSGIDNMESIILDVEKDTTDTEYAVDFLIEKGYKELILLGCIGSRIDHTFGNIRLLSKLQENNIKGYMKNSNNKIYVLGKGNHILEKSSKLKYISFIPLKEDIENISLLGFKYKLEDYKMFWNNNIGLSNEFSEDKSEVKISNGLLLTIESRD